MVEAMDEQVSFPVPRSLGTRIHMRLVMKPNMIIMYLTTTSAEENPATVPMGTMVYALPNRYNPDSPLSTTIYKCEPTFDFTNRLAKILVKKTKMHVYVTSSISLADTGFGGTAEEEMGAFMKVFEVAMEKLQPLAQLDSLTINGTISS